jgi:hypothetical protein
MLATVLLATGCATRRADEPQVTSTHEPQAAQSDVETKETAARNPCKRAGCSGELCVSVDSDQQMTPCNWQMYFQCYDDAECAVQEDGSCGWTETEELRECIDNASREQPATRIE